MTQCVATTKDGRPCSVPALTEDVSIDVEHCYQHNEDPRVVQERDAAHRRGGHSSRKYPPACRFEDLPSLASTSGLREYYSKIIESLWPKASTPAAARVLAELGRALESIYILEHVEGRLNALERGSDVLDGDVWQLTEGSKE